jgi:hypothetical protein
MPLVILAGTRKGLFVLRGEEDRRTSELRVVAAIAGG